MCLETREKRELPEMPRKSGMETKTANFFEPEGSRMKRIILRNR
jgi:hypothetical protein